MFGSVGFFVIGKLVNEVAELLCHEECLKQTVHVTSSSLVFYAQEFTWSLKNGDFFLFGGGALVMGFPGWVLV